MDSLYFTASVLHYSQLARGYIRLAVPLLLFLSILYTVWMKKQKKVWSKPLLVTSGVLLLLTLLFFA